ncbi:MAG: dTDP-4-dehydrorhamnose reductase [Gammaproteobacteria bacterium]|nr:MAG: dTDP-4-dehydrorhamnose reductase [Gammaproteobacteria bacterium]RLA12692.1 MAG: dTDP-4-dehydrorhamnose reductase [Gammaproteobacteria bacterium]RLA17644.1 MAG: dTDP-4-dehydrorhamnose reductase [Gammaproteobacteria bacterium]
MRVLLTGAGGQLGRSLRQCVPTDVELLAPSSDQLDITNPVQLEQWMVGRKPELVINCAAYTQVDQAESDPQAAEAINHIAIKQLAGFAGQTGARVLHISTDYVFDGEANRPYLTSATCAPRGVYGASKRRGELALLKVLPERSTIVRTSWLYSEYRQNFLLTMLRLMANRQSLSVVVDQIGTPTHCGGLAEFLWWAAGERSLPTVLHWADAGVASWYDFATAIMELACQAGLLPGPIEVLPIASRDYPQVAPRPAYSVLDASQSYQLSGMPPVHWRAGLRRTLARLVT